jgi:glycerol-3-phosphate cytidylyltransferase
MVLKNLIARKDVARWARKLQRSGKKIVFTNGVFDILHRGHVDYLARARASGDVLILGLNTDASVRRLKGKSRPIQSQRDRAAVLLALEAVDNVVLFGEDTPDKLIRQIRPDVLVKGADYRESEIVGAEFVKSYGGRVRRIRLTPGRSSSRVIKLLSG